MHRRRFLQVLCLSAVILTAFLVMPKTASAADASIDLRVQYWNVANKKTINIFRDPYFDFYMDKSHVSSGFEGNYLQVGEDKYSQFFGLPSQVGTPMTYSKIGVYDYKEYYPTTYPNFLEMQRNLNVNRDAFIATDRDDDSQFLIYSLQLASGHYDNNNGVLEPIVPKSDGLTDVDDYDYLFPVNSLNPLGLTFEYHGTAETQSILQVDLYDENKQLLVKGAVPMDSLKRIFGIYRALPAKDGSNTYYDNVSYSTIGRIYGAPHSSNYPSCGYSNTQYFGAQYIENMGIRLGEGTCSSGSLKKTSVLPVGGISYLVVFQSGQYHPATKYVTVSFTNTVGFSAVQSVTGVGVYNMEPTLHSDGKSYFGPDPEMSNVGEDKDYSGSEPEEKSLILEIVKEIVDFLFIPEPEFIESQIEGMVWSVETALGIDGLVEQVEGYASATPVPPDFPSFEFNGMLIDFNTIVDLEIYDDNRELFTGFLKGIIYFFILLATLNNVGKLFGFQLFNSVGILTGATKPEEKNSKEAKK